MKEPKRLPSPTELYELYQLDNGQILLSSATTTHKTYISSADYEALVALQDDIDCFHIKCLFLLGQPIFEVGSLYKSEYLAAFEKSVQPQITQGTQFIRYENASMKVVLESIRQNNVTLFNCVYNR